MYKYDEPQCIYLNITILCQQNVCRCQDIIDIITFDKLRGNGRKCVNQNSEGGYE